MQNILESKLGVYQEFLNSKGYDQINLDIILREKTDAISKFETGGSIELPVELREPFTPMGNPPSFMSAYTITKNRSYAMVFKSEDTAVNLTLSGELNSVNPLTFMHILEEKLGKILVESRDGVDVLEDNLIDSPMGYNLGDFVNINQIDTVIYNFLTDRPILVIGPVAQAINVLIVFLLLIPEQYQSRYGYSINMPYFPHKRINFAILDNVPQYNLEQEVNTYLEHEHSIVNLYENSSYGEFSCDYTKNIVASLRQQSLEDAKAIVSMIYELAHEVKEGESAQGFGDRTKTAYDNADLVLDVAKNVFGGHA